MNWIKILQSATRLPKVNSAITTTTGSSPNYYLVNKQQSGVLGVGKILFSKRAGLDKGDTAHAESLVWERKLHLRSCGHVPGNGPNVSRDDLAKMWAEDSKRKAKRNKEKFAWVKVKKASEQEMASILGDSYDSRQFVREPLRSSSPEEAWIKPLLSRSNLLITRDIEWANLTLGFEQENRYAIVDVNNPQVPAGYIREQSNVIARQLLRTRRPFVATITDGSGNELFRVRRPFWWLTSSIYTEVGGKEIGVVHRRWHLWRRIYDLYLGNEQFAVVENPGFWNWTFTLKDINGEVLAEIDRDWRGFGFEVFTDAGQYVIRFGSEADDLVSELSGKIQEFKVHRPLTLSERAVTVALAVSLDNDYFSRHGGWGLPLILVGE
uniref:altered inheritance rate of mitochondria protein 25 n=1 Tax=Erigeron canadensis TaxID=72917 RepID=UPI001CB9B707|nr:altered inheritance rate of mitochondria protein 25 [Erigeron canadensis]